MRLKIYSWIKRFLSAFKRAEKPEVTPWGEEIVKEEKKRDPTSFRVWLSNSLRRTVQKTSTLFRPMKTKIHVKFLLKGKRYLTGGLCFIYLIVFFFSLPNPISILFFATFFILLDYLWKTRNVSWVKD